MIMKNIFMLVGAFIVVSSFARPDSDFTISGQIKGLHDDSVIVFIQKSGNGLHSKFDTIACKAENDVFHLQGNIDSARMVYALLGGIRSRKSFRFYIEKGNIQIKGDIDSPQDITVTGTFNNDVYSVQNAWDNKIYAQMKGSSRPTRYVIR